MKALYLVKGEHLRDPVRSRMIAEYDVLICDPSVPVEEIRAVNPTATIAAYFNAHTCPAYGPDSEFYKTMRVAMNKHFATTPGTPEAEWRFILDADGNYELTLDFDTYEAYAKFINEQENVRKFDMLYLDELWGALPAGFAERTGRDANDADTRWAWLTDYFLDKLYSKLVIANVGQVRPKSHRISAISIEQVHIARLTRAEAMWKFAQSAAPDWNIAWNVPADHSILVPGVVMKGDILP